MQDRQLRAETMSKTSFLSTVNSEFRPARLRLAVIATRLAANRDTAERIIRDRQRMICCAA
jgi:hypothetical protein